MGSLEVEKRILRSTAKLPSRMEKESLRLVPENVVKFNEVKQYPYLNENNNKIRFNPFTGEIYIATYRHNLKRELQSHFPEREIILMQRGRKPSREIFQRWNQYPDVECAIRSADHVLESYGKVEGDIVRNTRGAINLAKRLLTKFELREINKENIEKIAQETSQELDSLGFGNAEKPIKQQLALQISKATEKDKLERVNPLISRTRLASAWLKAIRELLVAKKVREKFYAVNMDLLSERSSERFYLSQTAILMQDILKNQNTTELKLKIRGLKEFSLFYLTPEKIKVAPYRKPALLAKHYLFGVGNESERNLAIVMSADEQKAVSALALTPIDKVLANALFKKNAQQEIQERLTESFESIEKALGKGAKDLEKPEH